MSWRVFKRRAIPVISSTQNRTVRHRSCRCLELVVLMDSKLGLPAWPHALSSRIACLCPQRWTKHEPEYINACLVPLIPKFWLIIACNFLWHWDSMQFFTAHGVTTIWNRPCPRYSGSWGTKIRSYLPRVTQCICIKAGKQVPMFWVTAQCPIS